MWRQREDERGLNYEREHQRAEERRRNEQQKRGEEERRREEEWKRGIEEERKAHAEAVKKWAEKAAILNTEVSILMY